MLLITASDALAGCDQPLRVFQQCAPNILSSSELSKRCLSCRQWCPSWGSRTGASNRPASTWQPCRGTTQAQRPCSLSCLLVEAP